MCTSPKIPGDAEAVVLGNLALRTTVLGRQNISLFSDVSVLLAAKALSLLISMFFLPLLSLVNSCPSPLLVSLGRGQPGTLLLQCPFVPVGTAGNTCLTTSESP